MSKSSDLLNEMKGIFGGSFGQTGASLISEAQRPMPSRQASEKGLLSKKKGGMVPSGRGEKSKTGSTITKKKLMKAAAKTHKSDPKHKEKQADDEKKFQGVMKDIRGEMDKSHQKSDAKKKAAAPSGGSSTSSPSGKAGGATKGAGRHNPFKRSPNLGKGPRGRNHDETKCWKCKCGNVYADGCDCVASGSGEKCPDKGTEKHIKYDRGYKKKYNDDYHAWRAGKGGDVTRRLGSTR